MDLGLWSLGDSERSRMFFSLSVLYTSVEFILKGVAPAAVADVWRQRYRCIFSQEVPFPSTPTFRAALIYFMKELDMGEEANSFLCPICDQTTAYSAVLCMIA